MGEEFLVKARGPLPDFIIGVAHVSGQILWPCTPFFNVTFESTVRQFLKVVDKSDSSIRNVYKELLGCDPPQKLVVT